jgi:hypothetical protein
LWLIGAIHEVEDEILVERAVTYFAQTHRAQRFELVSSIKNTSWGIQLHCCMYTGRVIEGESKIRALRRKYKLDASFWFVSNDAFQGIFVPTDQTCRGGLYFRTLWPEMPWGGYRVNDERKTKKQLIAELAELRGEPKCVSILMPLGGCR